MIGTKLAHYEITAHLGSGGMGDVYQATDLKLKRSVAIKLLPAEFSSDAERLSRFRREAQVLASLNHTNIAHIYGLEESADKRCIVMELVEGETLQARLKRGPIPVEEALAIAKQICEALEAAHEKGVIHRDLKPGNVMLTGDGKVKVLDFGLAKAMESDALDGSLSNSPTLMSGASIPGVILGTASYMSPEQAKGRRVDKRTDIFAFGCVLYEMLTGKRTFDGDDVSEILARVIEREADWTLLPASAPPRIKELLRLCLEKNAKNRRGDASDVRIDIELALKEPAAAEIVAAPPKRSSKIGWIAATSVMTLAFAFLAAVHFSQKSPPEMRLEINTPLTSAPFDFALSPDGRYISFVASGDGQQRLWLRALDKTDAQPVAGTEGALLPFWSPDSRSIGFYAAGKLKRVDIAGGSPQTLCDAPAMRGGTWNADGTILFAPVANGPLSRIAASGGEPAAVTKLDPRQTSHRFPQFLPDGHHFLFYAQGPPETSGIYLGSLDGGDSKRLAAADTAGAYLAPDTVVFIRQTALMAQHLDLKRGELTGDPVTVADPVGSVTLKGGFSVSADGRLAYRSGGGGTQQLSWFDRTGKAAGVAGEPDSVILAYPELSPDGRRVAVVRNVQSNSDIWLMDLARGGMTRFTTDPSNHGVPVWSPDGTRIAFRSNPKSANNNLYVKPSSGVGAEELLLETPNQKYSLDWSKDGRFLLYSELDPKTGADLWALPVTGNDRKPISIANSPFDERNGQFSPDGRWVAYETNESGRFEIEVQPFPNPNGKWQVSTNGGVQPRWLADGKELYFIAPDAKLMAATINTSGATFAASPPVALFPTHLASSAPAYKQQYAVSRDGRFLLNQETESSGTTPITLILNWSPKLK